MPDDLQLKHERFCGEKVLEILGILHSDFRHGNPDDFEPDLIFKTGVHHIGIEVTSAYPEDDPTDTPKQRGNSLASLPLTNAAFTKCLAV